MKIHWELLLKNIYFNTSEKYRLKKFRNTHAGQSCWVIGNGPSINYTNILALKDQCIFIVNNFVLNEAFEKINPTYYVATNPRLMRSDFLKYDVMPRLTRMKTACFLNIDAKRKIKQRYENVYYLLTTESPLIINQGYNLDITRLLFGTRVSVIIQAVIPIAVYMGFKTIYLTGCDSDYKNFDPAKAHFYKENATPNLQRLTNYTLQRYAHWFDRPEKAMMEYHSNAVNEWTIVSELSSRMGVKIINCTVGGKLDVFPRRRLEEILK